MQRAERQLTSKKKLFTTLDKGLFVWYIIVMKDNNTLDPNNDSHWMTHRESQERPHPSSPLWNDWAAKNPTPAAIALGKLDIVKPLVDTMTAISKGARPIEL